MTSSPPPEHEWRAADGAADDEARDEDADPDAPDAGDATGTWAPPAQDQTWPADGSWPPPPPPTAPVASTGVDDDGWRPVRTGRTWEAPGPVDPAPAEGQDAWSPPTEPAETASGWAPPTETGAGWVRPTEPAETGSGWAPPTEPAETGSGWAPPTEPAAAAAVWPPAPEPDEDAWIAAGPGTGGTPQPGGWPAPPSDSPDADWAPPAPAEGQDAWGPPAAESRYPDWTPPAPAGDGAEPWTPGPDAAPPGDDGPHTWPSSGASAPAGEAWATAGTDAGEPLASPDEPWTPAGYVQPDGTDPGADPGNGAAGESPSRTWVADEATGTVRYGDPVGWSRPEPAAPAAGEAPSAPLGAPPRSPAYTAPVSDAYQPPVAPPPLVEPAEDRRDRRKVGLIALAVLAVVALAGGLFAVLRGGGGEAKGFSFGQIAATGDKASVVTETGTDDRALEVGEDVLAGWVIAAKDDSAVTIDLDGGGVMRFDRGASLTFSDLGRRGGSHKPAVQIDGGRTWINPAGQLGSQAISFTVPGGTVATSGNPIAVDCTSTCSIEAPAGGVTLTTTGGAVATPGENEKVSIDSADNLSLLTSAGPSDWAQQNLDADKDADVRSPGQPDTVSVKAGAHLDGAYLLNIKITSEPTGDDIPDELKYHVEGGTYSANITVDGSACVTLPCDLAVTSTEGASGTARIADGALTLTLNQPVNCTDPNGNVIMPNVGTDVVQATMPVIDARLAGDHWRVVGFQGTGTIAATLATPCSPDMPLGTATSEIAVSGTATN
jgi:hypothetical protein